MTMTAHDPPAAGARSTLRSLRCSPWFQPLLGVFLGLVVLVVMNLGGHADRGVIGLGVMTLFGVFLRVGGRSETIRGLRGDGRDERFELMRLKASSVAGRVVILAVVAASLVEVARGHSGAPYTWLSAVAGLAFLVTIGVLRWRS
jgi:hypothetical protein